MADILSLTLLADFDLPGPTRLARSRSLARRAARLAGRGRAGVLPAPGRAGPGGL